MKVIFLTNYFNHHQKYISKELNIKCESFFFVSTSEMREERKKLGYGENSVPSYVIKLQDDTVAGIDEKVGDSDVTIIGSAPYDMVKNRIKGKKLVFRYSERPLKNGDNIIKYLPRYIRWHRQYPKRSASYLLCASAYTAYDYSRYGLFKDKAYKWGYFPETKKYDVDVLMQGKDWQCILWCGRFLDLKHPDDAVRVAKKLRDEGYSFTLNFIGRGEKEEELLRMIEQEDLSDCVRLLGAMSPEAVRAHMEKAGIFLFTSDKQEGWGAVLNESMNSGCAVVASHAIGSVPFLIKDGENGCIYESGNIEMLYEKVKYLLDHPNEQKRLGTKAYHTIVDEWNAEVAAERLLNLAQHILDGEKTPDLYESGPCSRAPRLTDKWAGKDIN